MMKIKEMQIVFENFEILKIPYQYVGQMRLDYITDSIIKVNNLSKEDNVTEYKFANSAFICIDSKFNKVEYSDTLFNKQQLPFDRINEYNDISCIDLIIIFISQNCLCSSFSLCLSVHSVTVCQINSHTE